MAREPVPGRVKTRLAASVGARAARDLYEAMLSDAMAVAGRFARAAPGREALVLVAGDPAPVRRLAGTATGLTFGLQIGAGLGARLEQAFVRARGEGVGPMLVCGTDCPQITLGLLEDALRCLRRGQAALAPSLDGGYALLGLPEARPAPGLFSLSGACGTLRACDARDVLAGWSLETALLPPVTDVDTLADVEKLLSHPETLGEAPATRALLHGGAWPPLAQDAF